jgi:hypothetical protein
MGARPIIRCGWNNNKKIDVGRSVFSNEFDSFLFSDGVVIGWAPVDGIVDLSFCWSIRRCVDGFIGVLMDSSLCWSIRHFVDRFLVMPIDSSLCRLIRCCVDRLFVVLLNYSLNSFTALSTCWVASDAGPRTWNMRSCIHHEPLNKRASDNLAVSFEHHSHFYTLVLLCTSVSDSYTIYRQSLSY